MLMKVYEKIVNDAIGALDGQTDNEDSLSDTNKPKVDEEKSGLNRKVKKLKMPWPYIKGSSHILEPSSKARK